VSQESVKALLRFSMAFTKTVYQRIGKLAGDDFLGFKMAADHGVAIIISTGSQSNSSLVSLSPAANAPAKQLRFAEAGTLRIRTTHYKTFSQAGGSSDWINILVKTGPSVPVVAAEDLMEQFASATEKELQDRTTQGFSVKFANREHLSEALKSTIGEPLKIQGFGFRADLDGFSKQVEAAFAKGGSEITKLVTRFCYMMQYLDSFQQRLGHAIKLPWAGDCANLVILPNGYGYEDSREFLPVRVASEWHSQMSGQDISKVSWSTHANGAQWSIGVAGGDDDECSNGYILVAPLKGRRRDFLVATGWGVGRSLDAQEADGVLGGDTILHEIDHKALASTHKVDFSRLNGSSIFWVSNGLTKEKVRSSGASTLAPKTSITVPGIKSVTVPPPKPWFTHGR
jgi:hypothetical protein